MKRLAKRGFTLVEIMIVVAIIALLAAIAIPNVLRGRTTANESAAIGNIRALVSSLEMYRSVNQAYPDGWVADMYTNANPDFGPPAFVVDIDTGAAIQGYTYDYDELPATCTGTACTQYQLLVTPVDTGRSGTRSFFTSEAGVIRHCEEPTAGTVVADVTSMADDATIDAGPTVPCT